MSTGLNANIDDELNFDDLEYESTSEEENKITIERRKAVREPKQEAKGNLYYLLKIDKLGKITFETNIGRIVFGLLVVSSIAIIFWEFGSRLNLLDDNVQRNTENNQLTLELEELKKQWSESDLQKIEQNIKKAEAKIFDSMPNLALWLKSKKNISEILGFSLKYNVGSASKVDVDGTYSMPITFDLIAKKDSENTYAKALNFIRSIIDENRRLEIVSTKFMSVKKGVSSFSLNINLWVRDPNEIIPKKSPSNLGERDEFIQ